MNKFITEAKFSIKIFISEVIIFVFSLALIKIIYSLSIPIFLFSVIAPLIFAFICFAIYFVVRHFLKKPEAKRYKDDNFLGYIGLKIECYSTFAFGIILLIVSIVEIVKLFVGTQSNRF